MSRLNIKAAILFSIAVLMVWLLSSLESASYCRHPLKVLLADGLLNLFTKG
jgi:hypothetical protein